MIFTFIIAQARAEVRGLGLDAETERRVIQALGRVAVPWWVSLNRRVTALFALQAGGVWALVEFVPSSTVARVLRLSDWAGDLLALALGAIVLLLFADAALPDDHAGWFSRWRWVGLAGLSLVYVALVGAAVLADSVAHPAGAILAVLYASVSVLAMWSAFADRWAALQVAWLGESGRAS